MEFESPFWDPPQPDVSFSVCHLLSEEHCSHTLTFSRKSTNILSVEQCVFYNPIFKGESSLNFQSHFVFFGPVTASL